MDEAVVINLIKNPHMSGSREENGHEKFMLKCSVHILAKKLTFHR
jgi:hypothetical protein